jgi:hypothetical protein
MSAPKDTLPLKSPNIYFPEDGLHRINLIPPLFKFRKIQILGNQFSFFLSLFSLDSFGGGEDFAGALAGGDFATCGLAG